MLYNLRKLHPQGWGKPQANTGSEGCDMGWKCGVAGLSFPQGSAHPFQFLSSVPEPHSDQAAHRASCRDARLLLQSMLHEDSPCTQRSLYE